MHSKLLLRLGSNFDFRFAFGILEISAFLILLALLTLLDLLGILDILYLQRFLNLLNDVLSDLLSDLLRDLLSDLLLDLHRLDLLSDWDVTGVYMGQPDWSKPMATPVIQFWDVAP